MFNNARSFNQPLNNWNVSNVRSMRGMFQNAKSFNQPLNNWNVSNVTDMNEMFWDATSLERRLDDGGSRCMHIRGLELFGTILPPWRLD